MQTLVPLVDAASGRRLIEQIQERLAACGQTDFRFPPPEPTSCCGRGCNGCVWEGYFFALAYRRDEAVLTMNGD